uniref:NADH-ubiquinone oxidoreductase chain 4L n=1 Tax=Neomysis awatschensis TaxID=1049545 RepID=A0A6M3TVU3_9CRUS|nr:NADH dehydrogenase subunit 4L [Neomysis awatschensis]
MLYDSMYFVSGLGCLTGLYMYIKAQNHFLTMLLSIELFMINSLVLFIFQSGFLSSLLFSFFFIVMAVCEGVIGLSIGIKLIRLFSSEYVYSLNLY